MEYLDRPAICAAEILPDQSLMKPRSLQKLFRRLARIFTQFDQTASTPLRIEIAFRGKHPVSCPIHSQHSQERLATHDWGRKTGCNLHSKTIAAKEGRDYFDQ